MTSEPKDPAAELEALYTEMALNNVEGLWRVERKGPDVQPFLWKWETMKRLVTESGRLVDIERPGERRAVAMVNPGIKENLSASHTLYAAIQLVRPGEVARAHRHTPNALRFVIQGEGASTTVEGEKVPMHNGDLVLSPNWSWHEHRNEGSEDVIWLDGLDSPFVFSLNAAVYEPFENGFLTETRPPDLSGQVYGLGTVRPIGYKAPRGGTPLLVYRWEGVKDALQRMNAAGTQTDFDGVAVEYINPSTGGHTLSTTSCWMQMLRPGEHTKAHRHTHCPIYHVHKGEGHSIIDGKRYDWSESDSFVVPPMAWHEHVNEGEAPAYLFSMSDMPVLESFDLNQEEVLAEGFQAVTSTFQAPG
jgi:gentisate 1,2-dioxygenase